MKIAVFGATGKTGIEVVKQALEKGIEVNAFVRDSAKLQITDPKLKPFTGDALNPGTLDGCIDGVDAVIVTLSGIMASGLKNIMDEMKTKGVSRLILMSSYPMSGSAEGMNYLKSAGMDETKINQMMPMIKDKEMQEKEVAESGLTWTIVRPTFLKDEPKTGGYTAHETAQFSAATNGINRADVADFLIKLLSDSTWNNKVVSISS